MAQTENTEYEYYRKNDAGEFEPVKAFSQDQLEETLSKRLIRERAKYSDYEDLKEKVEKLTNGANDTSARIAEFDAEKKDLQTKLNEALLNIEKQKVLREFNIKSELEEFITGSSAEEMRTRAEKLSRNALAAGRVDVEKSQKPEPKISEMSELARGLFGELNNK